MSDTLPSRRDEHRDQTELFSSAAAEPLAGAPRATPGSRFGSKIRSLREHHGISQRELARSLGVSPAYLSQLESGKKGRPNDRLIHAICHQFGLIWDDADDLFAMADSSHRFVKIDTSDMDERRTALARQLAVRLKSLSGEQLDQLEDLVAE